MATPLLRVSMPLCRARVIQVVVTVIPEQCRCVSEYSSASDKGVAFRGDREASLEASPCT